MKITGLEIEGFGKLINYRLDLSENINEIHEENGFGKTTIAHFIRVMLFGFENENKKEGSERIFYKPRKLATYGGRLMFTTKKGSYCLSRVFADRAKDDISCLKDAATGLEVEITGEIGEWIFGIDAESYFNSAYLGQGRLFASATPGIQTRAQLQTDPTEIGSFDRACDSLYDCIKNVEGGRKASLLPRLAEEKTGLLKEINRRDSLEKTELELEQRIRQVLKNAEGRKKDKEELEKRIKKTEGRENSLQLKSLYDMIRDNLKKREQAYDQAMNFFTNGIPEDEEIHEIMKIIDAYEDAEARLNTLREAAEDQPVKNTSSLPIIGGLLSVLAGLSLILLGQWAAGGIAAAIGGLLLIAGLVQKRGEKSRLEELDKKNKRRQAAVSKLSEDIEEKKRMVSAWFGKYRLRPEEDEKLFLGTIAVKKAELDSSYDEYEKAAGDLEHFEKSVDMERLLAGDEATEDIEGLKEKLKDLETELKDLDLELSDLGRKHDQVIEELSDLDEKTDQLRQVENEQKRAESYLSLAKKTLEYLKKSRISFTSRYTDRIMSAFAKYAAAVLGGSEAFEMDANLHLSVRDGVLSYPIASLSAGYQDLVYLCLRSAFLELCFDDEKPFIILDDPFVNLDEDKLSKAKQWVREMAADNQILYFCCHSSRKVEET